MSEPGLFAKYVVDTGFFSDLWTTEGSHPRDLNQGLWSHFEKQVEAGEIIAPQEVREELDRIWNKDLDRWLSTHRSIFCRLDRRQFEILERIVRKYPDYTQGTKDLADPAVVALAGSLSLAVLTTEKHQVNPSLSKPKIPNLAEEHAVHWLGVNDYMRAEKIVQA